MPSLKRKTTAEKAAAMVIEACIEEIETGLRMTVESDDPEGPHTLRIGLRRLRVALSFFRPAIDSHASRRLAEDARWLGREIGKVRDLEVARDLLAPLGADADKTEPNVVAEALSAAAAAERDTLRHLLSSDRITGFLRGLKAFVTHRGWLVRPDFEQTERLAGRLGSLADRSLGHRWRKAVEAADGMAGPSVEERHEFRKELKKLRYSVEFMSPVLPNDTTARFLKRLRKLQGDFGHANDIAVAARVVDRLVEDGVLAHGQTAGIRATLDEMGTRAARDLDLAQKHWRRLEQASKPWE